MKWTLPGLIAHRKKNAPGFKVLAFALALSVFSVTVIFNLTLGLKTILFRDASQLLGADLILESPDPIDRHAQALAKEYALNTTELVDFFSMLMAESDMELATVSAIKGVFPLRGKLKVSTDSAKIIKEGPPQSGEIWLEEALLLRLNLHLNDAVSIGAKQFKVTGIVQERPVATTDLSALAPLAYVNENDLAAMQVLQPGSRVTYRLLVAGNSKSLGKFTEIAKPMLGKEIKWVTSQSGRASLSRTLEFAQRYLSIILLIQVLLAGMAIAITAHQHSLNLQREVALWRCLGASHKTILFNHIEGYLILAMGVMGISIALAYVTTYEIAGYLKQWGDYTFPLHWGGIGVGIGLGVLLLGGFGLPPLIALKQVSPKTVLQQSQHSDIKINIKWYGLTILLLMLLFAGGIQDYDIVLKLSAQIVVMGAVAFGVAFTFWKIWEPLSKKGGLAWRLALSYLTRYRIEAVLQCVVFTMVIMLLSLVYIFQADFIKSWQAQLPSHTPNYFLLNVQPEQLRGIKNFLEEKNIHQVHFFPIVRGRLTHINGESIDHLNANGKQRGLYRPINLTWMKKLPDDNRETEGISWDKVPSASAKISVENEFAKRQGVKIGDSFSFDIGGQTITGEIVQLRTVEWESFRPNFFVIFPPKVIENFGHSYITSFHLPPTEKTVLIDLVKKYPELSIIDIGRLLERVKSFTNKIALALTVLLGFVGVLGILIMYASMLSTLKERMHESALLRILGAKVSLVKQILLIEFAVLGAISGLLGSIMSVAIAQYLARNFFMVPFSLHLKWIALGMVGAVIIPLFGMLGARAVFSASPLRLFRQTI